MRAPLLFILFALILVVANMGMASPALANGKAKPVDSGADPNRPQYVKISPLILPLIGDNGVEQIISLIVAIEVPNKEAGDKIIEVSPRLNDAFMADLYGSLDRRENMKNGLLDVTHIKERLTKVSTRVLGADKFKEILVQAVTQHPA